MDENDLKYSQSHEWVHLEDGLATVGISRFAVDQLTDVTFVELPEVGASFGAGEAIGVIESVKTASDLYTPVAGEVVEVNEQLAEDPAALNEDPYDAGWIVRLRAPDADLSGLMDKKTYDAHCEAEGH